MRIIYQDHVTQNRFLYHQAQSQVTERVVIHVSSLDFGEVEICSVEWQFMLPSLAGINCMTPLATCNVLIFGGIVKENYYCSLDFKLSHRVDLYSLLVSWRSFWALGNIFFFSIIPRGKAMLVRQTGLILLYPRLGSSVWDSERQLVPCMVDARQSPSSCFINLLVWMSSQNWCWHWPRIDAGTASMNCFCVGVISPEISQVIWVFCISVPQPAEFP